MTLLAQVAERLEIARQRDRAPARWIATPAAAAELAQGEGVLLGLPVEIGTPRSEWGLELVCAPPPPR